MENSQNGFKRISEAMHTIKFLAALASQKAVSVTSPFAFEQNKNKFNFSLLEYDDTALIFLLFFNIFLIKQQQIVISLTT